MKKILILTLILILTFTVFCPAKEISPKDYFKEAEVVLLYNFANKEIVEVFKGEYSSKEHGLLLSAPKNDLVLLFIKEDEIIGKDGYIFADYDKNEVELTLYSEAYTDSELEDILSSMEDTLVQLSDGGSSKISSILFRLFLFIVLITLFLYLNNFIATRKIKKKKEEK